MPRLRRLELINPPGSGGGQNPGTIGNFRVGPDFGESSDGNTWTTGYNLDLEAIRMTNDKQVGINTDLQHISMANEKVVGFSHDAAHTRFANEKTVGFRNSGFSSADPARTVFTNEKQLGFSTAQTAMRMANDKAVGLHLAGTVYSAPFWQTATSKVGTGATQTSIVIDKPSGTVSGSLLIACVGIETPTVGEPITPPSGWTDQSPVAGGLAGGTPSKTLAVFTRVADGTEGATFTFTFATATNSIGEIHRVAGSDPTTPINIVSWTSGLTADPVGSAVTTTDTNCLVFAILLHDHGTLNQTHTPPANHAEVGDLEHDNTTVISLTISTRGFAAAADTGTATVNCTETVPTDFLFARVAVAPGDLIIAA